SSIQNTSFVGEGLAGATSDSAPRNGVGCVGAASRWATPPLRTTGCLKTRAARCIFLGLELAPEGSLLHAYIGKFRFARLRRAGSWLSLRFDADMTPPWAVRDFQEGHVLAKNDLFATLLWNPVAVKMRQAGMFACLIIRCFLAVNSKASTQTGR